jgi:quercetin dioxygenase-like cupin family protein
MSAAASAPSVVRDRDEELWWYGGRISVQLTGAQTGGRVGTWVWDGARGAASPLHVHHREEEYFFVVDGEARLVVGGQRIDARAGDLVALPREVPHAYLITSPTARLIGMASPGGFESFFSELATPVVEGEPPAAPPEVADMVRAAAARGVDILGPPPALD